MTLEFKGKEKLIRRIDDAISGDCPHEITACLRDALCKSISDPDIELPELVYEPIADHYARREIYHDPQGRYCVIAMTWDSGQGTPIHDHGGLWCVEGVWSGCIEVVSFEPTEQQGDRYRFEKMGSITAGCGSAGSLIPPHEYHTIRNPDPERPAVSVHIYGGMMVECCLYEPTGDGWCRKEVKQLELDAA